MTENRKSLFGSAPGGETPPKPSRLARWAATVAKWLPWVRRAVQVIKTRPRGIQGPR